MKFCPECGAKLFSQKFCQECGANIAKYLGGAQSTDSGEVARATAVADSSADLIDISEIDFSAMEQEAGRQLTEKLLAPFEVEQMSNGKYIVKKLKNPDELILSVPDCVQIIGENAFANSKVIEVSLPEGLVKICAGAFRNCADLETVNFPKSLRIIEKQVFSGCALLDIEPPANIRCGEDAFSGTLPDRRKKAAAAEAARKKAEEERKRQEAAAAEAARKKAEEERKRQEAAAAEAARKKAEEERKRREAELAKWNIGGHPTFGSYYKDNGNSKSPIEWIVLKREGNKALLISKYGIDCRPYNPDWVDTTWETAPLRKWLNNEFLNTAFNRTEQAKIQSTRVITPDNASYGTKGGNATTDKIFLLSIDEAEHYFSSKNERLCTPTAYAVSKRAYVDDDTGCGWWWLRSPGYYQCIAADVDCGGVVHGSGDYVYSTDGCVRPALWVNLES